MALEIAEKGKNFVLYSDNTVKLLRVRASFPHLHEKWANREGDKEKYACAVLMKKDLHKETYQMLSGLCQKMVKEKNVRVAKKDIFLKDGDDSKRENEFGYWTFNCSETRKPSVYHKDGELMADNDIEEAIPAGVIIDIIFQPWVQNNAHGTKVNASLRSVRFREDDGVRFGAAGFDSESAWAEETEEEEEYAF